MEGDEKGIQGALHVCAMCASLPILWLLKGTLWATPVAFFVTSHSCSPLQIGRIPAFSGPWDGAVEEERS